MNETLLAQYKQSCIRELSSCNNFRLDYLRGASWAENQVRCFMTSMEIWTLCTDFDGVIKMKTFIDQFFFRYFIEYLPLFPSRGMQWLCIPSSVSMERREHETMNGWMISLLKLDRLFLHHRKNLLEEVFFSSFTVSHTEWASDSSYEVYGDNTFRMDTILISIKKIMIRCQVCLAHFRIGTPDFSYDSSV